MAKVLLVNPIIRGEDKPRHVPYGLTQIAALGVRDGHQVQVFDINAWRPSDKDIESVFKADDWDIIATGGLVTTYGGIKKIVTMAREHSPNSFIIVGGGVITPMPYEIMEFLPQADLGVIGEAYLTFPEVLKVFDKDKNWKDVLGIVWKDEKGKVTLNPDRPLLEDLDSLPYPAFDLFPMDIYFENSSMLMSEESMTAKRRIDLICSYGCPLKCKYCFHLGLSGDLSTEVDENGKLDVVITSNRRIRAHSPRYAIDMIKHVKEKYDIDFINFLDENFSTLAHKSDWFKDFSKLWKEEGLQPQCIKDNVEHHPDKCSGVHWGTTAHPAYVTEEILSSFKEIGCAHLDYGFESFDKEILRKAGKGAKPEHNHKALKLTVKAGIRPVPNQIIGFPDESFESIKTNVDAWEKNGIHSFPFFATPYPGSEWYYTYKDRILEQYDGDLEAFLFDLGDGTKITAVISKNFSAVELIGLRELMVNRDRKRINEYERFLNSKKTM